MLIAWVAAEAAMAAWRAAARELRTRRKYRDDRQNFSRRVEAAARAARASKAMLDWKGWRAFRVEAVVDEAPDVKSFYFTPVDGRPLAPFAPGQYLTFRLPLGATPLVRCYSLSDRPRQDYYRTTIKRIGTPPDAPDATPGRGSSYFHDRVRVGDVVEARAPSGTFLLDPQAKNPIVLVGAGIGVTPIVSMLEALASARARREVQVLLGFRNGRDHPFRERVTQLAQSMPNVHLHVSYSRPLPEDVLYRDYNHQGRITIERLRTVLPSNNYDFYVCGPGSMMESLVPALWDWGVPEAYVHFEAFGPASVKGTAKRSTSEPCDVRFARSGHSARWDGSFASLLEFGEAAGIALPSGCRAGSCGECMTAIQSGTTLALKSPGVPVPPGHCLTCVSVPAGELVLDA